MDIILGPDGSYHGVEKVHRDPRQCKMMDWRHNRRPNKAWNAKESKMLWIDSTKYPVADRNNSMHDQKFIDFNDPMWSDAQRQHATICTRVHIGHDRCRFLDVPANGGFANK